MYEVRRSRIQGRGCFAIRTIRAGTRIVEYLGERISNDEACRRYDDYAMKRHHTFLFAIDKKTCLDAAVGGNDAKYINHSCEPNCEAVLVGDRIFVEALRTIRAGEELTYDYRYIVEGPIDEEEAYRLYGCKCGAPTCRGTILRPELKRPRKGARRRAA